MKIPEKLVPVFLVLLLAAAFLMGRYQGQLEVMKGGSVAKTPQVAVPQGDTGQQANQPAETEKVLQGEQLEKAVSAFAGKKGQDNASVTIVEFTDYQCPYCVRYVSDTLSKIEKDYVDTGKVKYLVRDFPLPFHSNAVSAAQAVRCAADQGKYWEMHDKLFTAQNEWISGDPAEKFASYAAGLGMNKSTFSQCLTSEKYKDAVEADLKAGQELGVSGTPSFFINGKLVVGALPYESFKAEIEAALQ